MIQSKCAPCCKKQLNQLEEFLVEESQLINLFMSYFALFKAQIIKHKALQANSFKSLHTLYTLHYVHFRFLN